MKRTKFMRENKAVAGVIEALLMVALVAIILSMIQLYYIPQIMEQKEADHMDDVTNQFSFLKAMIDFQSMVEENVPISSPITLGSEALPYFVTMPASGQLNVIDNQESYNITVDNGTILEPKVIPLTSIKYEAFNFYYIDQIYILEGGCIIVSQSDGETVRVEPTITVQNQTNDVNIYYEVPIIVDVPGKNITSGYKNCFIRTNYSTSDANWTLISNVSNIQIFTEYSSAWNDLMEELLEENVNITEQPTYVEITKNIKQINLYYKETYIYAQIGPGWIK